MYLDWAELGRHECYTEGKESVKAECSENHQQRDPEGIQREGLEG